MKTVGTSCKSL